METAVQNVAEINNPNEYQETPLYRACQNGHLEDVKLLLKNVKNINNADKYQRTPLYVACENGHLEVVKLLIKNGADINKADAYQQTPLYIASFKGHLEVVEFLLKNNETSTPRRTLLEMSCEKKNIETARFFLILDPMLFFTTRDPNGFLYNNFKKFEFLPRKKMYEQCVFMIQTDCIIEFESETCYED